METMLDDKPIRIEEAAKYLQVPQNYLNRLAWAGKIKCYKPNGIIYFLKSDLRNWVISKPRVAKKSK